MSSPCSSGDIVATAVNQELWRPCNEVHKPSHNRVCFLAPVTFTAVHQWQEKPPSTAGGTATSPHANCLTSAICRALIVYVLTLVTEITPIECETACVRLRGGDTRHSFQSVINAHRSTGVLLPSPTPRRSSGHRGLLANLIIVA